MRVERCKTFHLGDSVKNNRKPTTVKREDCIARYLEEFCDNNSIIDHEFHWTPSCAKILSLQPWIGPSWRTDDCCSKVATLDHETKTIHGCCKIALLEFRGENSLILEYIQPHPEEVDISVGHLLKTLSNNKKICLQIIVMAVCGQITIIPMI